VVERTVSGAGGKAGIVLGIVVLVLVGALASLPWLGDRDFWPQDEARYGTVTLEMWKGAHPAVPSLNGEVYQDKPPGYFWVANLAATLHGGVDEWAARVPSVLGAVLLAIGACLLLAPAAGWTAGLCAGLIALASWLLAWEARQAHLDALFGGLIALAMAAFTRALEPGRERWTFAGFVLIGLAVLVKGPLAFVAVGAFALATLLLGRPRAFFNGALLPGLLMALLPPVFWLGWAYVHLNGVEDGAGLEYVRALFKDQVAGRVTEARAHEEPWHYYLRELPLQLLPFFPVVLLALVPAVRRALGPVRPAFVVAATWLLVGVAAQSVFPGKRALYLVPLVAPFAVVCASVLHSGVRGVEALASAWTTLVACVVFIAGGALVAGGLDDTLFAEGRRFADARVAERLQAHEQRNAESRPVDAAATEAAVRARVARLDWPAIRRGALIAGIAGLVLSAIALTALALGAVRTGAAWTAVAVAAATGLALGGVLPAFDVLISRRPVVEAAVAAVGRPGAPIGWLRHLDEAFPYYAGRPVRQLFGPKIPDGERGRREFVDAAAGFLTQRGAVLVARPDDFHEFRLGELAPGGFEGPLRAGGKQFFLLKGPP
jgi:4-amino-4-deoxy-L-arabinose transferase-like glycosyltransferase